MHVVSNKSAGHATIIVLAAASLSGCVTPSALTTVYETPRSVRRMADGKLWTTRNLELKLERSFCYGVREANCVRYGRLYTWDAAQLACARLGEGWRLPSNEAWLELARRYGGVREEGVSGAKAAFHALTTGGGSGFDAVFGGGRSRDAQFARADAHGFYWTSTTSGAHQAWFYNFAVTAGFLNRHQDGDKAQAFSVRCVHD